MALIDHLSYYNDFVILSNEQNDENMQLHSGMGRRGGEGL